MVAVYGGGIVLSTFLHFAHYCKQFAKQTFKLVLVLLHTLLYIVQHTNTTYE